MMRGCLLFRPLDDDWVGLGYTTRNQLAHVYSMCSVQRRRERSVNNCGDERRVLKGLDTVARTG